jgi:hypothetical protein
VAEADARAFGVQPVDMCLCFRVNVFLVCNLWICVYALGWTCVWKSVDMCLSSKVSVFENSNLLFGATCGYVFML